MSITVLGVNHRTAPLDVRERFAHERREVPASLERVLAAGARGGVLLSTCNRTEFYLAEADVAVPEAVWAILSERLGGGRSASEYGYTRRDRDAVRHLYRVSAGLDAVILGESQIQGQVRDAWETSKAQAGPVLHRLFQSALLVGARVRSETGLATGAASAPSPAVRRSFSGRETWRSSPRPASRPRACGSAWWPTARTSAPGRSPSNWAPG